MLDALVICLVLASLPVCFLYPHVGSLLWWWVGFMNPYQVAHGFAFNGWFGTSIAVATVTGAVISRERFPLPRTRECSLLLALWLWCTITTAVAAIEPWRAFVRWCVLSGYLIMTLVSVSLFQDRRRLAVLLWVTALSLGAWAVAGALWVLRTGGAEYLSGPPHSQLQNNNDLAAALVALAPFVVFLGRSLPQRWLRHATLIMFGAMVVAILGTYSRASFLALCVMIVMLAGWKQWRAVVTAGVAFMLFLACTSPVKWAARVDSIRSYQADASAMARPPSWYVAVRIGLDHPIFGAGFRPFTRAMYARYIPGYVDEHDAHNHFLQVFAEHGFPGLVIYSALLASTLLTLWRIARGADPEPEWSRDCARMLFVGLCSYVVAGMFHCLSYREIYFQLIGLAIIVSALDATHPEALLRRPTTFH